MPLYHFKTFCHSSAQGFVDRDWAQAIQPYAALIAAHLNRDLIQGLLGLGDVEFRWTGLARVDEQSTAQIWRTYYQLNVMTPNEMRARLGLTPLTCQWGDMVSTDAQIAISAARGTKKIEDQSLTEPKPPQAGGTPVAGGG